MKEELQPDFVIGNMATDLVEMTLQICNKQEDKTLRFPKVMYSSYVAELVNLALEIQKLVCVANSIRNDKAKRQLLQENAIGNCVCLEKDILLALKRGWISEKQFTRWQKLICNLHWKLFNWLKM